MQAESTQVHVLYNSVSSTLKTILGFYMEPGYLNKTQLTKINYRDPGKFLPLDKVYIIIYYISFIMSCVWVQFSFSYSASLATNGLCWVCNMCKIACSCIKTSSNGICNHYFFTNIASFWDLASISKISRVTSPLWATLPKCLFWVKIN